MSVDGGTALSASAGDVVDFPNSPGVVIDWIVPKNMLSSAMGVFLGFAGSIGGESPSASTTNSREQVKVPADTRPVEFPLEYPRYEVSRNRLARQIVSEAIRRYRQPDGYEGYLVEAAWQLEQIGKDAWPILAEIARARIPECEYFLADMIRAEGVSLTEQLSVLRAAARNPDANVRSRLLELASELPLDLKHKIVSVLASHQTQDDALDRARDYQHQLVS